MKKLLAMMLCVAALLGLLSGCAKTDDGVITDKPHATHSAAPSTPASPDVKVSAMPGYLHNFLKNLGFGKNSA